MNSKASKHGNLAVVSKTKEILCPTVVNIKSPLIRNTRTSSSRRGQTFRH
jgi:hypothetical protein